MSEELDRLIRQNYARVLDKIAYAARAAGREPDSVCLVVVTKGQPLAVAQAAVRIGVRVLGENYPEEALTKIHAIREEVEWHMIGHVQSRKARLVCDYFAFLHSLDSVKLANRLERMAVERKRCLPVLLEFNVSGEATKWGWPAWEEGRWPDLLPEVEQVLGCEHLEVRGLMTVPPFYADPEQARPFFRKLRCLRDFLAGHYPQANWRELSMGMSADFEVAIQEGATFVRVGQAILGSRGEEDVRYK
ncbi:MAG: YggS family pyridoxal phosphate-dependent enzyme [Chloroflexota bacterium]